MSPSQLEPEELKLRELEQLRQKAGLLRHRAIELYRERRKNAATLALPMLQEATTLERVLEQYNIRPVAPPAPVEKTEEEKERQHRYDWLFHIQAPEPPAPMEPPRKQMPEAQTLFNF